MDTLIIEKKDDVYLTVDCDPNIQREISEFFTLKMYSIFIIYLG